MDTEPYMSSNGHNSMPYRLPPSQTVSPQSPNNNPFDMDPLNSGLPIASERERRSKAEMGSAIRMRKLARQTTPEALRSMLLFAKDFISADFIPTDQLEDQGYLTAIARFRNPAAAQEAQSMLHGKQINPNEHPIFVEILRLSPGGETKRTFDMASNRANSNSSNASSGRQSSRFNGAFQAIDHISPPNSGHGLPNGLPNGDNAHMSNFFSPQSPISNRQRATGKAVIGEDGIDDEPGDLLKDPIAYANGDTSGQLSRRSTNSTLPTSRYAGLSLSTSNATSPPMSGFSSPSTNGPLQSPNAVMSPTAMGNWGPNSSYQMANQYYQRNNNPPSNPADQNPPCNTIYVGNLPIDTSEDELKTIFSKQRGYKRLCFRTKSNGPMCFVEFEDISFATRALKELYGRCLHNSVKGGIRLSFSKNPLGVRLMQPDVMGPSSPMSPSGPMPRMNGLGLQGFSTANGPPPGLAAPPGLHSGNGGSLNGMVNGMANQTNMNNYGMNDMGMVMNGMRSPPVGGQPPPWGQGGQYFDQMYGH